MSHSGVRLNKPRLVWRTSTPSTSVNVAGLGGSGITHGPPAGDSLLRREVIPPSICHFGLIESGCKVMQRTNRAYKVMMDDGRQISWGEMIRKK